MHGPVETGQGRAAGFVAQVDELLAAELGFVPFHGTLNVGGTPPEPTVVLTEVGDEHCEGVELTPCRVGGVRAAVLRPIVPGYPDDKTELVAPVRLRSLFGLGPGDRVDVVLDDARPPNDCPVDPTALSGFDAVVFSLDALTALLRSSAERDHGESADDSLRETLVGLDTPVGVCATTSASTAEETLDSVDASDGVDVVVGSAENERESPVGRLRACLDRLGAAPGNSVFVGDPATAGEVARRVGTSVLRPDQLR